MAKPEVDNVSRALTVAGLVVVVGVCAFSISAFGASSDSRAFVEPDVFESASTETLGEWVPDAPFPLGSDRRSGSRMWHRVAVLSNGVALICGGTDQSPFSGLGAGADSLPTCGRYDTTSGVWERAELVRGMPAVSAFAFAPLPGSRALLYGGVANGVTRPASGDHIYDFAQNRFDPVDSEADPGPRAFFDAASLPDGRVIVYGGWSCALAEFFALARVEALTGLLRADDCTLYDDTWVFEKGDWTRLEFADDSDSPGSRALHMMAPMDDGRVLMYGGAGPDRELRADTWILDPEVPRWRPVVYASDRQIVRAGGGALSPLGGDKYLLSLGLVSFVDHGMQSWVFDASDTGPAENPTEESDGQWTRQSPTRWTQGGRDYPATFPVGPGRVMLVGGQGNDPTPTSDANLFCLGEC